MTASRQLKERGIDAMASRVRRGAAASNSRECLLDAWLLQHAHLLPATGMKEVRRRIESQVKKGAHWFDDIEPVVALGRGSQVGWTSEPIARAGNGVDLFMLLLDRVGPLAIDVCARGRDLLEDPALRQSLIAAGIPEDGSRYSVDFYCTLADGGSRLLAALSDAIDAHLRGNPSAARVLVDHPTEARALVDSVTPEAVAAFVQRAVGDGEAADMHEIDLVEALDTGLALCVAECPADRDRRLVAVNEFETALAKLSARWIKSNRSAPISPDMAARFAHLLIDPDYESPQHAAIRRDFESQALGSLRQQARRLRISSDHQQELVAASLDVGLGRLRRKLADAYVDPRRAPDTWDGVIRAVTQLRGAQELFTELNAQPSAHGSASESAHEPRPGVPWLPGPFQPGDFDPVESHFWSNRDLHLTQSPEYAAMIESIAHKKEPTRSIAEIRWLALHLVDVVANELGVPSGRPVTGVDKRAVARAWIGRSLSRLLSQGLKGVAKTKKEARARNQVGGLFPGVDVVTAVVATCPAEDRVAEYQQVGLIVERSVLRATVVVFGRDALDGGPDNGVYQ